MKPAGLENGQGVITAGYLKDPTDTAVRTRTRTSSEWKAFMQKYYPNGSLADGFNAYGYAVSTLLVHVLKQAGDDLTRANIMKQAASVKDLQLPMLIAGIKVNTSATDFYPVQSVQMHRFKGESFEPFGDIISGEGASQ